MRAVSDPLRNVLDRLDGVKQNGRGFIARCPAHDDHNPSLSIREGDDGRVLVHCFAGCEMADIAHAIGMKPGDFFLDPISPVPARRYQSIRPSRSEPEAPKQRKRVTTMHHPQFGAEPVATYEYRTEIGALVRVKARYSKPDGKKTFLWFSPAEGEGWYMDKDERAPEVLYGTERLAAQPDTDILLTESEKDKDALEKLGLLAVSAGGADNWHSAMADQLAGRDVAILTHNDEGGRMFTRHAAADLMRVGAVVRDVQLPGLPEKGDVVDWLDNGGTVDRLIEFVAATKPQLPQADSEDDVHAEQTGWDAFKQRRVDLARVIREGIEPPEELEAPVLLKGRVHCFFGGPEQGKTMILLHLILRVLRQGKRVIFFDEEIGPNETAERFEAMGATDDDLSRLFYFPFETINNLEQMAEIVLEGVRTESIELIALDSISKALNAAKLAENSNDDCTTFMRAWVTPAAHVLGATVVYLDHTAKVEDDGSYSRGASSKLADTDVQWHVKAAVAPTRFSMGRIVLTKKKDRTATVPSTVRYIAGGDGSGILTVGLEASDFIAPIRVNPKDEKYVTALYEEANKGMTFADWERATGAKPSTFKDARRRLVNSGAVVQEGEHYFVSESGIRSYGCESLNCQEGGTVQYGLGTGVPNRPSGNGGTVWDGVLKAPSQTVPTGRVDEEQENGNVEDEEIEI